MKHWGIWLNEAAGWMTFDSQLCQSSFADDPQAEIRSFEDWEAQHGRLSENTESKQS